MKGQRQLDVAEWIVKAAAVLLAVDLAQTLFLEPFGDFVIGDDRGAGALGDGHGIADVIVVAVRDEDEVGLHLVRRGRRCWIAGQKRIDQDALTVAFQQQASMPQPAASSRHDKPPGALSNDKKRASLRGRRLAISSKQWFSLWQDPASNLAPQGLVL